MQTKIRFGVSDLDYVGIDYFRSKSGGGCKLVPVCDYAALNYAYMLYNDSLNN